jgi:hypothetical protein
LPPSAAMTAGRGATGGISARTAGVLTECLSVACRAQC